MKATVTSIAPNGEGQLVVSLATDYGTLVGHWDGSLPQPSSTVHVELEFIPESINAESENASYSAKSPFPSGVLLVGVAESWSNGVLFLKVGPSLVQVECMDERASGRWLAVRGHALRFFDTNL